MKRGGLTKKAAERAHFKTRAMQRFSLNLTALDIRSLSNQIRHQADSVRFVSPGNSLRTSIWDVTFNGTALRVVYDKQRHTVVTAYPPKSDDDANKTLATASGLE